MQAHNDKFVDMMTPLLVLAKAELEILESVRFSQDFHSTALDEQDDARELAKIDQVLQDQ